MNICLSSMYVLSAIHLALLLRRPSSAAGQRWVIHGGEDVVLVQELTVLVLVPRGRQ